MLLELMILQYFYISTSQNRGIREILTFTTRYSEVIIEHPVDNSIIQIKCGFLSFIHLHL